MRTGLPGYAEVTGAAARIRDWIHRTPVMRAQSLDALVGAQLHFKCENFQRSGAFKFRGASNAVLMLQEQGGTTAVATHSSGNHGAALAMAAARAGFAAHVVVPRGANPSKLAAIEAAGARIVPCEPTMASRLSTLEAVVRETGAEAVPPFEDARIIAGQGTAAMELLAEIPDLDLILVPVGGGGLLAGTLLAANGAGTGTRVWGAEPALADAAARSLAAGSRQSQDSSSTLADGLRAGIGEMNYALIADPATGVAGIARVSEAAIVAAMRLIWERLKILVEPSSAVPLAALLDPEQGRRILSDGGRDPARVGIILTGGNVDLSALPWN